MADPPYLVKQEADRLLLLPHAQARQQFGDRIARAFLLMADPKMLSQFWQALEFNAHLATELGERAQARRQHTIWETTR